MPLYLLSKSFIHFYAYYDFLIYLIFVYVSESLCLCPNLKIAFYFYRSL